MTDTTNATAEMEAIRQLKGLVQDLQHGLDARIQTLEDENEKLRRRGAIMVLGVAVLLGLATALVVAARHGFPGTVAEVIESRSFVLRDAQGAARGMWGVDQAGALRLTLQADSGKGGISLMLLKGGASGVSLTDRNARPRVVLGVLPDETTTLTLADKDGVTRTVLGLSPNGASTLVFADRAGSTRAGVGIDARGVGTFTLDDHPAAAAEPAEAPPLAPDSQRPDSSPSPQPVGRKGKPKH